MLRLFLAFIFFALPKFSFAEEDRSGFDLQLPTVWEYFKSPLTTKAKTPLLIGSSLTLALALAKNEVVDPFQEEMTREEPLGSASKYGDLAGQLVPNVLYVLGATTYGWKSPSSKGYALASGMFWASFDAVLVTTILKYTIQEPRPNNSRYHTSFPSGHTTSAFAFAGYVGCQHNFTSGVAAYALATFVGLSRINDNAHFLHDVVGGATIGTAFGLGVCLVQNKNGGDSQHSSLSSAPLLWLPQVFILSEQKNFQLALRWETP